MPRGGKRPGAGRKPKEIKKARLQRLDPLEEKAFQALERGIKANEPWAVKLFFQYRYGMPVQMQPDLPEAGEVVINVVVDNGQEGEPAEAIASEIIKQIDDE